MLRRLLSWLGFGNGQAGQREAVLKKAASFPKLSAWELDPYHTQVRFRVMHMGLVEVVGRFRRFSAQVRGSSPAFTDLEVEAQIEVGSVETDLPARDFHIKSSDFLDEANYPYITFRSRAVKWRPLKRFVMEGDLTIKGVTHRIVLEGELKGLVLRDLVGHPRVSFALTGQVDRRAWGLTWQAETGDGTLAVDNLVTIEIEAELTTPEGMQAFRQFAAQVGMTL